VQLLEHQNLEHQHHIEWLCARLTFSVLFMHPVEFRPKRFPVYQGFQSRQGGTYFGQLRGSFFYIE
jgi:hypothetical protein